MKKITFGIMLFYSFVVQAQISVSNIETPAQLVQNVLIGQGVVPTNITFNGAPGNAVREQAGHFTTNFNGSNLGIDSGVVMSTGKATAAPGPNNAPNTTSTPTNALIGDADLSLLATGSIGNVSVIEFDFVATGLELNFDYVFASEEYPEFVNSTFNDVFGFFLRGPGISGPYSGNAKNIALVPNSTTPITINNVNNGFNNSGGGPNSSYYYNNTTIGANPNTSVAIPTVIYDGFTTLLTAKSSLICGGTYHIKLAIGNVSDNQYDSAVFLKNFRIKPLELLDNLNLSENLNVCYGQVVTIDSNLIPGTNVFEWTKDGVVIAGETGTTLTVTESGVYGLTVFTDYGCQIAKDDIEIGYLPEIPITPPLALNNCTSLPPPYVFNIDQTSLILSTTSDPTGYIVSYYDSSSTDAADGSSTGLIPDADLANYTVSGSSRTIWVRVEGVLTGCVVVRSFTLSASLAPSGTIFYPQLSYCSDINTPQSITTTVTPGGIYSENTGGLNIDPLTGAINPSLSLPGNYTVNYNLAASGSCPAFSATPASVTIGFSPPTPVTVIVQPTCAVSTGTITITAPLGVGLEYSVDNGATWQSSPVFASVSSGSVYNIIVRSISSQCTSPVITGTMNPALGVPSTPVPTLTQSANCNTPTGTITISSPAGANFEYSNDGGTTYQPSGVFAGLSPGASYNFTVRDIITGCVSAAATASVNAMPGNPPAPTATLVQPTCTSPTGSITITAPTGASLEYSIDGIAYQSGRSFTGLSANSSYGIVVRDISTGCVSAPGMFAINALPASPAMPVVVLTQPTCAVNTGSFTISSPLGAGLQYSIDNGITYQGGASFSGLSAGISYTVVVQDTATGCISNAATVAINPAPAIPAAPTASVTVAPTCAAPTGTIGINAPLGANLEYSIDGGLTYQSGTLFAGLTPGMAYSITVRNTTSGCVSPQTSVTVAPMPAGPPAPAVTLTQSANCNTPTGTITISSPVGANFEYSNDGGTTYQPTGVFAGLSPGASYNFTVRDIITGCVSAAATASVNAMPGNPPAPTATLVQPTCTSPTGSITITAPTGASLEYSIDGVAYQSGRSFTGLSANSSYGIVVRDISTGCVSAPGMFAINALPASPAMPVVVLTQPTCAVNTGSFTISSPLGAGLQYSIDNGITYQGGASFSGLAAGISYTVVVQDTATGCISNAATVAINPAPAIPAAPTASVTVAPTCAAPTGTIGINAPLGANLEYSIDGGLTYQSGTLFAGLTPGMAYSITVRNTTSGCVSPQTSVTVAPMPAGPPAPAVTLTQSANCNTPTGTITISSPVGANFEYSNDGGTTYQPTGVFAGLSPGASYNFTVRDIITGCVSAAATASVNAMPGNPPAPTATLVQPTCTSPTGSITITSPIGAGLSYSIDNGVTFQNSNAFASVPLNSIYMAVVKDVTTGCVSSATRFVINPTVLPPATPLPSGNAACIGESINLNVATVPGAIYEWTGPNGFTSSLQNPILANATPEMAGTYNVTITLIAGCSSLPGSVNITVNPIPQPTLKNGNICVDSQTNTVLYPFVLDTGLNNSGYTFEWFEFTNNAYTPIVGATQATYTSYVAGNYGVRATNSATGCKSDIVKATVSLSPTPNQINVVASEYFSELQTITVNVFPAGNYHYQLDNGALQTNNVFTDVASGNHTVYIKSECGDFSKEVMIMDYPHYFTPNGDGYNDTWNIFALSTQANAKIYIFDRLGKLLKEISPSGAGWDGTYNQHSVPSSDYWFIVHYSENSIDKEYKSHFALKR